MSASERRLAVVLFNLGGPDGPSAVRPFLRNLFSDPAIIGLPAILRGPLAELVSRRREAVAKGNYALMGGGSPLLGETRAQAQALQVELARLEPDRQVRVFIAMRYWSPFSDEVAREVAEFDPHDLVLLPLYPQYSGTTTGSSLKEWSRVWRGTAAVHTACCWFANPGLIQAHAEAIAQTWRAAGRPRVRLLFSAHGLPQRVIDQGDPYAWQVRQTCEAVAARLGEGWDWQLCYQSRVGPLKWLGPSTPEAIEAAAADGLGVLIDPIAFVSDHVETLVELDIEYAELAHRLGVTPFLRAPVTGCSAAFIEGLAGLAQQALQRSGVAPDGRSCPDQLTGCACRTAAAVGGAC